jgi:5-formyltetrahydrofolate cyclo-ligase
MTEETDITAEKKVLRRNMRSSLSSFFTDWPVAKHTSEKAAAVFLGSELYRNSEIVLAFLPGKNEIDATGIITKALADGKQAALPRVVSGTADMEFYYIRKEIPLEVQCSPGAYGIREPGPDSRIVPVSAFPSGVVVIVPGLVFSPGGDRLGKGRGFYDRYFARIAAAQETGTAFFPAVRAGYCFSFQIADRVPSGPFDVSITHIITETCIISCTHRCESAE